MGRGYGYAPRTVPTPLLIAAGVALFILLMYLTLFLVSKKACLGRKEASPYDEVSIPYYETPSADQPAPAADRPWWEATVRREEGFRQDAYEAFQRQDFDTDRHLEKIEQDKEFFRMQRSVSRF